MRDKNKVSAVTKAKLEFDSIVNLAKESLLKESEEKINKLIEEAIEEVQNEEEIAGINEGEMKIETPDMKIVVDADGSVSVDHKEPEGAEGTAVVDDPVDAVTQEPVAPIVDKAVDVTPVVAASDDEDIEITADEDPIEVTAEADANQQPNMNPNDQMPAAAAPAPMPAAAAPAPAPAMPPAEGGDPLAAELASVIQKMIAQATGGDGGAEDGVDIVDDEAAGAVGAAAPMPADAPAPMAEEVSLEEDELIELELEEDDDVMDEIKMMGVSNTVRRKAGASAGPAVAVKNRALPGEQKMNESTDKVNAQHEATIAELKKENAGLKGQLKEFKTSFIEMREQWNEVQNFQKKLSLAYRVIANGGLTEKEKARISERFEAAKDAEEAEKIYKEIISEKNIPQDKGMLKTSAIPVAKSKKEPIYESTAVKRAKTLAGIDRADQD